MSDFGVSKDFGHSPGVSKNATAPSLPSPPNGRDPVRTAFRAHRHNVKRRGLLFRFTFHEWVNWWGDDLDRATGKPRFGLRMVRRRGQGAYEPSNVYKTDKVPERRANGPALAAAHARRKAAGIPSHLAVRGDGHPKSKAVHTPAGRFGSAALAAEHYGITRAGLAWRCKNLLDYWYE